MADSYICPTCDHEVIVGESCLVCASKEKSERKSKQSKPKSKTAPKRAWEQDEGADGLDLPDEDFDYDGFVEREFGTSSKQPHQKIGIAWYWCLTACLLCLIWILSML